jgi:hypothetical protein
MQKPIKKTATKDLEKTLDRTKKALKNAKLTPLSITFYGRRRKLIEDEIERRATAKT